MLRSTSLVIAVLIVATTAAIAKDSTTVSEGSVRVTQRNLNWQDHSCKRPYYTNKVKKFSKRVWQNAYGPSSHHKDLYKRYRWCAKTDYQREVRFPNLWHKYRVYYKSHRGMERLRKSCGQAPTSAVLKCIEYASRVHAYSYSTLSRIAGCESGYNPHAYNPSGASGLFQFMRSTFAATPYGHKDIFKAKWNALAAAWKMRHHGTGEWVCQ